MHRLHLSSGGRYPVLRALAILQLVSALFVGVGGIIGSVYITTWYERFKFTTLSDKIMIGLVGLAATFFLVIFTLAFAELIKLLIDIEHNTRMTTATNNGEPRGVVSGSLSDSEMQRCRFRTDHSYR